MAGRIVRQGRLLAALILTTAMLAPAAGHAQDVMVLPPANEATAAAPTPIPVVAVPEADPTDAAPSALPTAPTSAPAVVTTTVLDPKAQQCATDADCVLVTDGCGALDVVNPLYAANWKASRPVVADCQPVMDLTKAQAAVQPVCRAKLCGQQAKTIK